VAAARTAALGGSEPAALAGGFRLAFAVAGMLALGALAVAAVVLRAPAPGAVPEPVDARPCPA